LRFGWLKHYSESPLHRGIIPYNPEYRIVYLEELGLSAHGQFLCQLKQTAPLPGFLWSWRLLIGGAASR
jgi:hypothetical protein